MARTNPATGTTARTDETQLPNPPAPHPQLSRGASQADAVQHAEREVSSGAIDDAGLAAGTGPLPYERIRRANERIELASIAGQRADTQGTGDALVVRAKRGDLTDRPTSLQNSSLKGAKAERRERKMRLTKAEEKHRSEVEVLQGERPDEVGCMRPGKPIAAETTGVAALRWRLRVAVAGEWAPCIALLLVEGSVVAGNMRKYLRADDSDLVGPLAIAIVAVAVLTIAPFFIGRLLNDAAHGRVLTRVHRSAMIAAGVAWIGTGVLLALIRVDVDRAEALDKAREIEYDRVATARALGETAEAAPIDPDAAFDPVIPTLMWVVILIGLGVVMVLVEITTRNPARPEELARRIDMLVAQERMHDATEYVENLTADVKHQRRLTLVSDRQWEQELDVAVAAADLDIATHLQALAQHAGSPDMVLAIERRLSAEAPSSETPEPHHPVTPELPAIATERVL